MAKRFLSIFLGLMLLVSCMPAMAFDYAGEDGAYTIDLSGAAPALKYNGGAAPAGVTLLERGTVAIADDPTGSGEKVMKLTNGDSLDSTYSLASNYTGVGSALLVDMGDEALSGNVVVQFKFYDGRYTGELYYSRTKNKQLRPLHLSATYQGAPDFLSNTRGGNIISKYGSNVERAPILVGSKWHDYTVLFDTVNNKFKVWIDGTQYLSQNGGIEWFDLSGFVVSNGITNINFSNYYTAASTDNDGDVYFKDMSFGVCSGNTEEWCPTNLISETFDNAFSATTVNNYVTCHLTQNSWTKSDSGLNFVTPSSTNENLILENIIPTSTSNAPGTGYAFSVYNDSVNGYSYHGSFIGFGRITNATTAGTPAYESCSEPLAIEFDFCNMTSDSGLRTRPISFEYPNNKRDMDIVSFDDSGIYVGETCVKSEDTRGKWYSIKIVYNPNSDTCKVYINGEECNVGDIPVSDYALNRIDFGTGKQYIEITEDVETTTNPLRRGVREVYFDNIKIYNYDNNLVVEDVNFAQAGGTLSFSGNVVNKLDAEASVTAYPVLAVYNKDTGALEKVTIGNTITAANNGTPVTISASISEGLPAHYTAKAFVWKGTISQLLPFETQSYFGKFTYSK